MCVQKILFLLHIRSARAERSRALKGSGGAVPVTRVTECSRLQRGTGPSAISYSPTNIPSQPLHLRLHLPEALLCSTAVPGFHLRRMISVRRRAGAACWRASAVPAQMWQGRAQS